MTGNRMKTRRSSNQTMALRFLQLVLFLSFVFFTRIRKGYASPVKVEVIQKGTGPQVSRDHAYNSMVTLYLDDGKRTPSGWSTRKEDGADKDQPFQFQPGHNLIEGWTEGVLQMREGDRSLLHVPASKGYGSRKMGSLDAAFYIPGNSDLLFDIEILGKAEQEL